MAWSGLILKALEHQQRAFQLGSNMVGFPKTEKTYCERGGLQFGGWTFFFFFLGGWTFIEVERDYWQRALVKTRRSV